MKLYILEGCHGSGKTTFLKSLSKTITVINEDFCENTRFPVDSMLHQIDWLLNWTQKVLDLSKNGTKIAISDRGPNTSVILHGDFYKKISDKIFDELHKHNIIVQEILIQSPEDINEHYCRILGRKGPLMNIELKTLRTTRDKYSEYYKDHMWIKPSNISKL